MMAVVGSYVGLPGVFFVLFYSLIIGAFFSIFKLMIHKNIHERWLRLRSYIFMVISKKQIIPYYNRKKEGDTGVIPFGVAIGFGTLFSLVGGR